MKGVVTRQNEDGSYDEVGMSNRAVFGPFKRSGYLTKKAREFGRGRTVKVEVFFNGNIHQDTPDVVWFLYP